MGSVTGDPRRPQDDIQSKIQIGRSLVTVQGYGVDHGDWLIIESSGSLQNRLMPEPHPRSFKPPAVEPEPGTGIFQKSLRTTM